jgi:hypothetical protein
MNTKEAVQFIHFLLMSILVCLVSVFVFSGIYVTTHAIDAEVEVENTGPSFVSNPIFSVALRGSEIYSHNNINNLRFGEEKDIYVWGTVQDQNGYTDIDYVKAYLYRSDLDNTCPEDGNKCYYMYSCDITQGASEYQAIYSCPFSLKYWMDATDAMSGEDYSDYYWQLEVVAVDLYGQSITNTSRTLEVYSSVSLDIPESIDFGSMSTGESTTRLTNVEQVITQYGNVEQNVTVTAPSGIFACESGDIPLDHLKWSLSDVGYDHNQTTALSSEIVDTELRVQKQISEILAPTKTLYWNLSVPPGASGSCSVLIEILAKNTFFL